MTSGRSGPYWETRQGNARLEINPVALSNVLVNEGGRDVSDVARKGFLVALDAASRDPALVAPRRNERYGLNPTGFIGFKIYTESPKRQWELESGRIPVLSQALAIPVAIITNDSNYAMQYEVGSGAIGTTPLRPLLTAYQRMRAMPGVKGIRTLVRNSEAGSFRKEYDNIIRRRNARKRRKGRKK